MRHPFAPPVALSAAGCMPLGPLLSRAQEVKDVARVGVIHADGVRAWPKSDFVSGRATCALVAEETATEPFLVFRRSGKTIAAVVAFGFGGGTLLLGVVSAAADTFRAAAILPALRGYLLATLPFFVFGAILAMCRRELWFVPDLRAFRMLTFRPWRLRGPRVEQASLDEYAALCRRVEEPRGERPSTVIALVTAADDVVPVREFLDASEAAAFLSEMIEVTGLPERRMPDAAFDGREEAADASADPDSANDTDESTPVSDEA